VNDVQKHGRGAADPRLRSTRPHRVLLQLLDEVEHPPAQAVPPPRDAARGTEVNSRPEHRPLYSQD
jgi:hypothetical protein